MTRRSLSIFALVFVAGAAIALGGVFLIGHDPAFAGGGGGGTGAMMGGGYGGMMGGSGSGGSGYGPGMMGGSYGGMMGSGGMMRGAYSGMMGGIGTATVQTSVTIPELAAVRDRLEKKLAATGYGGFKVGEIMAFTNNDYVLVKDASGKAAFELLADPKGRWLIPEPGPNMMWNTSYGMMSGINVPGCPRASGGTGSATGAALTAAQAKTRADAWLAQNRAGEVTADANALPGYFTIDVTKDGAKVGMLSVNASTGAVWFHTWHGTFLADRDF